MVAAALSGAVAAVRTPGERLTSGLQHFAAGVVFAAAAIELLPGVLERSPLVAVVGFAAGIAVMFGFRAASEHLEHRREAAGHAGLPIGLAVAIGVDFFIDGLILGAGFASGPRVGVLLTVALAVEYLFVGLSLSATLAGTVSRRFVALAPVVLALLTVVGTAVGVATLSGASPTAPGRRAGLRRGRLHVPRDRGAARRGPRQGRDEPRQRRLLRRLPDLPGAVRARRLSRRGAARDRAGGRCGQTTARWSTLIRPVPQLKEQS